MRSGFEEALPGLGLVVEVGAAPGALAGLQVKEGRFAPAADATAAVLVVVGVLQGAIP